MLRVTLNLTDAGGVNLGAQLWKLDAMSTHLTRIESLRVEPFQIDHFKLGHSNQKTPAIADQRLPFSLSADILAGTDTPRYRNSAGLHADNKRIAQSYERYKANLQIMKVPEHRINHKMADIRRELLQLELDFHEKRRTGNVLIPSYTPLRLNARQPGDKIKF